MHIREICMIEKDALHNQWRFTFNQRQLSLLVAALIASAFFIFIGGYYWGKKKAAEEFSYKADQESLADQIYSSMCVLYDTKDESEDLDENDQESENSELGENLEKSEENSHEVENSSKPQESAGSKYFAALAGFSSSTIEDGKKMLNRLKARGFDVQMVERVSKTAKGQSKVWHQIITTNYTNKQDLQEVISQIAKLEHFKEKNISIQEMRQLHV